MKICKFAKFGEGDSYHWARTGEERVRKFSFLTRYRFKAESYRIFIYIVVFGKHLSE